MSDLKYFNTIQYYSLNRIQSYLKYMLNKHRLITAQYLKADGCLITETTVELYNQKVPGK